MVSRLIAVLVALGVVANLDSRVASARKREPSPRVQTCWRKTLRMPARIRLARMRLGRSRLARGLTRISWNIRGRMTQLGDRIEHDMPTRRGRRIVGKLRTLNPLSLGAFGLHKFKQDPWFLSTYGTWSFGFSNAVFPLALALGAGPWTAAGIRLLSGVPVDTAVLFWRQHYLMKKTDPDVTWGDVRRQLGREYNEFLVRRRQENRDFMAGKPTPPRLHGFAAALIQRQQVANH